MNLNLSPNLNVMNLKKSKYLMLLIEMINTNNRKVSKCKHLLASHIIFIHYSAAPRGKPHPLDSNHCVFKIRPKGQREPRNENKPA